MNTSEHCENDVYSIDRSVSYQNDKVDTVSFCIKDTETNNPAWLSIQRQDSTVLGSDNILPNIVVSLKNGEHDKGISIPISMERTFDKNIENMNGLMHIYHKLSHDVSLASDDDRGAVLDFMDKYFFNDPDRRMMLNAYMQERESQANWIAHKNNNVNKSRPSKQSFFQKFVKDIIKGR